MVHIEKVNILSAHVITTTEENTGRHESKAFHTFLGVVIGTKK
jgi:hypothetical protein